jgi:hypothetical protein
MLEGYISREAALKAANEWVSEACMAPVMRISRLFDKLQKVPAADVAEVVRCKNCKHRTEYGNCGHPRQKGVFPSAYPFDFCSYGKYKTNTGGATE